MLAAFACGVAVVQTLAALPSSPAMIVLVAITIVLSARRNCAAAADMCATARALALIAASAALGFGYSAWRAESRLADALAPEAEGADIRVIGIVDDLPQNGPQGARFEFAVERVVRPEVTVPARVSLAWFAPHAGDEQTVTAVPEIIRSVAAMTIM